MSTRTQVRERCRRISTLALGALTITAMGAAPAAPQQPEAPGPDVLFGPAGPVGAPLTTPGFGPAGSLVELTPRDLPAEEAVQLMIGAMQQGFEVVTEAVTDAEGRIAGAASPVVEIPDWVETDRPYVVIVADRGYAPLGRADIFHPTDDDGTLSRVGRVTRHGTCTMLVNDWQRYVLLGDVGEWAEELERVMVTGTAEPAGSCGEGIAIRVEVVRGQDR